MTNAGTLAAASTLAKAIDLDHNGHAFVNDTTGKITGQVAMGNGTNTAQLKTGSVLNGTLLGGTGDDTVTVHDNASFTTVDGGVGGTDRLVFDGAQYTYSDIDAIQNFDTVQLSNNSTVTLKEKMNVADGRLSNLIDIDAASTLAVAPSASGAFVLDNPLSGAGTVSTDTQGDAFGFGAANAASTGANFTGTLALGNSTFDLSGVNTTALTSATLEAGRDSVTTVGDGVQQIGGLKFNGGTVAFNASLPEQTVASGVIQTEKLDVSGTGNVVVKVPAPYVPSAPGTPNTANLLEQDDANVMVKLVELTGGGSPIGGAADLVLKDQVGNVITDQSGVDIAQGGNTVAKGTYDYRLSTGAQQDGLYASYGLKQLDLQQDQTLTLEQAPGATKGAADMSAKIIGTGNLAVEAGAGTVSISGTNTYTGETTVKSGTLQLQADDALGQTSELHIADKATTDLNGRTQTIGALDGQAGSTLDVNGGTLNIANGGISQGTLTGAGQLNVQAGTLDVQGANSALTATTGIATGATVQVDDAAGLGSGKIANDGRLALNGATGTLVNDISGAGTVNLLDAANVNAAGDNSSFAGQFSTAAGTVLTVSEAKNLGTASVANEGQLVVDTATDWTLANAVSGSGDLIKHGTGTLTAGDALTYSGKTAINAGKTSERDGALHSSDTTSLIHGGADIARFSDGGEGSIRVGAMGAYGSGTNFSNNGTLSSKGTVDGYSLGAYATWYGHRDILAGPYMDSWVMYGAFNNKVSGQGLATESYRSNNLSASLEAGYSFKIHEDKEKGNTLYVEPQAQVIVSNYRAGDHTEQNGTVVSNLSSTNVTTRLGVRMHGNMPDDAGNRQMRPFAELNWWHGPATQTAGFDNVVVNDALPANRFEGKVGLQGNLSKAVSAFASVGFEAGSNNYRSAKAQVGVKYSW
ncbi:autotransporter outer membrane beta-barrel domain-containing protein [Variovorax sp. J31P207]|uniref:autotransporter outer membrane beta-barrel domain-containing protein n=1 Tax=Variovorax sp. J31P207 TaxID=3053510 RepID=UPI002575277F|nr:autotransporter outer membrane beta-barrel domain-containing protein [Variovorax sp. J31P207]MDM0070564.1 autotransporter outer membrane beta-barrel domain-containing protein [Variovorax sp. J31P207]